MTGPVPLLPEQVQDLQTRGSSKVLSDRDCIRQYLYGGDESAFAEIVSRYRSFMRKIIFAVLGSWSDDAEDAEQEVLIALSQSLARYKGDAAFGTFVYRLTRNKAIDRLRVLKRHRRMNRELNEVDGGGDPLDISIQDEDRKFLYTVLAQLKEEERSLILLKDVEGFSLEEIADLTGFPLGTVKSRLHRGRNRMIKIGENQMNKEAGNEVSPVDADTEHT